MKIVVSGSTGLVGSALCTKLAQQGHEVIALTRKAQGLGQGHWDPAKGIIDPAALKGADCVVHLAGEPVAARWTSERKAAIRASRVDSTAFLLAKAAEAGVPSFVCASAVGYYGDRGDEELDESSSAGPKSDFLASVCRDWEARALALIPGGPSRRVIIRIGLVLSQSGGALSKMLPPFRAGLGGRLGSGQQWMSWIHLDDLVELLVFAATSASMNGIYNGVAPEPVRNAEFTRVLASVLRRPAVLPVPSFALKAALGEMSQILTSSTRVVPGKQAQLMTQGFVYRYPRLREALERFLGRP